MLVDVTVTCPLCGQSTPIGVSQGDDEGTSFSTTSCRRCGARFVALTRQDGTIVLFDFENFDPSNPRSLEHLAIIGPTPGKSGYHVKPPEYLGILDRWHPPPAIEGISDRDLETGIHDLDRVLYRSDGSARSPNDAAKHLGWRAVWFAQLNQAVRERLAGPLPLSFPPLIFISYRWAGAGENAWVAKLAHDLKKRGYQVLFDRDEPGDIDVPQMVSRIADARYFIAVLDAGYVERIGQREDETAADGWVFDEYNCARHLSEGKQLRILGLLQSGDQLPQGFRMPVPGTPGNVIDVREMRQLQHALDDVFPGIDNAPDDKTARRAQLLLRTSHQLSLAGYPERALECAQELTGLLPGIIDGPVQKIRVALQARWPEPGFTAAREALDLAPDSAELHYIAGMFAGLAGKPRQAAQYLGLYLERDDPVEVEHLAIAHQIIGSSLDDLNQVFPGLAHLRIARAVGGENTDLMNNLGFVLRRAAQPQSAVEVLDAGLRRDPTNENLLINRVGALIEAGRHDEVVDAIALLEASYPDAIQVSTFRDVMTRSARQGQRGNPVALVATPNAAAQRIVECSCCEAWIPLQQKEALCGRCGSVLSANGPCPSCSSDGRVALAPGINSFCPYCRAGELSCKPAMT